VTDIKVETHDRMAVVTIDRPHARNAIAFSTIDELERTLDDIATSSAEVVVLRGAGDRAFISGGDLKDLGTIRTEEDAAAMATRMRRLLDRVVTLRQPVIAAVNGHALGGGAEVAIAADIRFAADDVKIGFNQVALAIMPAWGGAERLAEIVGRSQALLLIGTGTILSAADAHRIGLVDRVVPRTAFESGWQSLAKAFADLPPGAAGAIKTVIAAAKPHHHPDLEYEATRAFSRLWVAPDHWQAVEELEARRRG
jgi:enoyl-CoA hydratase